jgi:hypothetical protein
VIEQARTRRDTSAVRDWRSAGALLVAPLAAAPFLAGCGADYGSGDKPARWDEVRVGMRPAEVSRLLGQPDRKTKTEWEWDAGVSLGAPVTCDIRFRHRVVTGKSCFAG